MINRRKLITGLISFVAAPAIVRASNLMPVKVMQQIVFSSIDSGILDRTVIATYTYMIDGSLKIIDISYKDFYIDNTRTVSERQ